MNAATETCKSRLVIKYPSWRWSDLQQAKVVWALKPVSEPVSIMSFSLQKDNLGVSREIMHC